MLAVQRGDLDQMDTLYRRYRDQLFDFFSRLRAIVLSAKTSCRKCS